MDERKLELLLDMLMVTSSVQAGQIAQLGGATFAEARSAAFNQYVRLLAASGMEEAGQMRRLAILLEQEFPGDLN